MTLPAVGETGTQTRTSRPKHIILMIADGCGYGMLEMAGYWKNGHPGSLSFEQFPVRCSVITFSLDTGGYDPKTFWNDPAALLREPTDSAAAGTAIATGRKAHNGVISLLPDGSPARTVLESAEAHGMSSGLVTTSYFDDATPSVFAAHIISRAQRDRIAAQMIETSAVDFISGCGSPWYNNDGVRQQTANWKYFGSDAIYAPLTRNLAGGDADGNGTPDPWQFIDTRDAVRALAVGDNTPSRVFALIRATSAAQALRKGHDDNPGDDLPYETPRLANVPTLAEQAQAALAVLSRNDKGFFLMVENEGTDEAGHMNWSGRDVEEVLEFEDAVQAVERWVAEHASWDETLLIVTADHDTGLPTGPGAGLQLTPMVGHGVGKLPDVRWLTEEHANRPVPLFAKGAGAELFMEYADQIDPQHGPVIDNTEIAALIFRLLEGK